jgi:hypothetical protein
MAKTGLSIPGPGACPSEDQIPQLLALTYDDDPKVRRLARSISAPAGSNGSETWCGTASSR